VERVRTLFDAHDFHEMDRARLLLDAGCTSPDLTAPLTESQAQVLGERLGVYREYLLGRSDEVVGFSIYHHAVQHLWLHMINGARQKTLKEICLLKVHGTNLDRVRDGVSEDPRYAVAVVLRWVSTVGSYPLSTFELWDPVSWTYPETREEFLSVAQLSEALYMHPRVVLYFHARQVPVEVMQELMDRTRHVSSLFAPEVGWPKWDILAYLPPKADQLPARRTTLLRADQHFGQWRGMIGAAFGPA